MLVLKWSEQCLDLAKGYIANSVLMGPVRFLFLSEAARTEVRKQWALSILTPALYPMPAVLQKSSWYEAQLLGQLTLRDMVRQPAPTSVL